ncbi:MAG TPA: DUF5777 family beta-barrel protein [Thermoanaerobaculia bacterium]|nr:DUF5777 family beta-barrel protein [Thermoanaerobaculia bacterium]
MIKRALACALLVAAPLFAQEDPYRPLSKLPLGGTLLSLPSPQIPAQGAWEVKFTHRFNQSLAEGSLEDQWHSLFGLDSNADVVFGASWTLRPDTEFSLARSNTNDTVEGAVKYVVFQQAASVPASVTVRGGVDWRTERNLDDRTSLFVQGIVSRQFGGGKAEVFLLPTFVTKAGRAVTGDVSYALFENAFNVPIAFAYRIKPPLMVIAELIPPNGDLPDEMDGADIGWSLGIKRAIGGHWFEVLLTNNQGTLTDQYVSSTFQGSGFDADDVKLGFNIERRFGRRRR